jgi:hypothetical protein
MRMYKSKIISLLSQINIYWWEWEDINIEDFLTEQLNTEIEKLKTILKSKRIWELTKEVKKQVRNNIN